MSQYTLYQSTDVGAPALSGLTGSLLNVLNQVLVTGYGSMPGAGWIKPLTDTGNSGSTGRTLGCFTMPTGSEMSLFINDAGPGSSVGREARLTGMETITSMDNGRATGSGQFPTVSQLSIGPGAVVCRKSIDTTSVTRAWITYADSSSFIFANKAEDYANAWNIIYFGDFYSIKSGSRDEYNCILIGKYIEAAGSGERMDSLTSVITATDGHFSPRSFTGIGGSIAMGKHSDLYKISVWSVGYMTYPNPVNDGLYISPLWVHEPSSAIVRGRLRGIWANPHPPASFSDGEAITGNGEFAGRTFKVIKSTINGGSFFIETSNTLDTN